MGKAARFNFVSAAGGQRTSLRLRYSPLGFSNGQLLVDEKALRSSLLVGGKDLPGVNVFR